MTTETIHTCSYACERPECIRAQRDELASRLTAPPPAAARGDVRGLVAKWRGLANEALRRSGTWSGNDLADRIEFMADELEAALAAEGVRCETCNDRGQVGGPVGQTAESFGYETFPCPDCAEGVQAGEVK